MEKFLLILENLPDENLMIALENERKNSRNDFPVRPSWDAVIAGIVFQHPSMEPVEIDTILCHQKRLGVNLKVRVNLN